MRNILSASIDFTLGFNEHEGFLGTQVMLSEPGLVEVLKAMWDIIGPYVLLQKHTSEITAEDINLSKFILYEYCGPLEEFSMNQFENFTKMCSDSFFWYGVHRFLDLHTQQATGNNFYYRMKYSVRFNIQGSILSGAIHYSAVGSDQRGYLGPPRAPH